MKLADKMILHIMQYGRKDPSDIMIPNFYHGLYEMDVFKLIKKTEFVVEYEVKISRKDFFNDFKKQRDLGWRDERKILNKHAAIAAGESSNRFFFVVPAGLVQLNEIPAHAGLIYFHESEDEIQFGRDRIEIMKPAPILHKRTFNNYKSLATSLSWREEHLRRRYHNTKVQLNTEIQILKKKNL